MSFGAGERSPAANRIATQQPPCHSPILSRIRAEGNDRSKQINMDSAGPTPNCAVRPYSSEPDAFPSARSCFGFAFPAEPARVLFLNICAASMDTATAWFSFRRCRFEPTSSSPALRSLFTANLLLTTGHRPLPIHVSRITFNSPPRRKAALKSYLHMLTI